MYVTYLFIKFPYHYGSHATYKVFMAEMKKAKCFHTTMVHSPFVASRTSCGQSLLRKGQFRLRRA